MSHHYIRKILLFVVTIPLLALAMYLSYSVYQDSVKRSKIKDDYSTLNSIQNGMLSVNVWKESVVNIVENQINEFELTDSQDSSLHAQLTEMLRNLIDKAFSAVQTHDDGFKHTIRKWAVNAFVDKEKIKANTPKYSRQIIDEVMKKKNKDKLKELAISKINEFAEETYDRKDSMEVKALYEKYNANFDDDISPMLLKKAEKLQIKNYNESFYILGIVGLYLLLWLFVFRFNDLRKPLFFMSVALAIVVLLVGLTSVMIEIDARINTVDFVLLGEHIKFTDQVIYYRSKSILQLVQILLKTGKVDSILVGIMVLTFSVILPISKLISTEVYLFGKVKWRTNKILHWLAFKSGKWSMADVMVVAIFMAYVGFNGILDNQLEDLNVKTDSLTSIATNYTSLQPGYILFIAYVIFGLILSVILKKILKKQGKKTTIEGRKSEEK